jgi:phage terminase large subunit GpA-like protein
VLEAISDQTIRGVLFVGASQEAGKTEILLCTVNHYIVADPSPQLLVTYSLPMAEKLSKHRIAPMIRETPELRGRVADPKSRDSGNTILDKQYRGGELSIVNANSPGNLAMSPKRVGLFDEIDRYAPSAGTEGDPVALALKRLTAYWNAREVYVTSPGIKKVSRSWRLWEQSDQREWMVSCPDCGYEQMLRWSQVQWEKDEETGEHLLDTAVYACESCGSAWNDLARWNASEAGRYVARAKFRGIAGFRVSALACRNKPLSAIVAEFLGAEELKVFFTTVLCEWWEDDETEALDSQQLAKRRESWNEVKPGGTVPEGVVAITVFADVQGSPARLEYEVVGWGIGEESWSLRYDRIFGDIKTDPNVLAELDRVFLQEYLLPNGLRIWPRACGVDAGYNTQAVYEWCKPRLRRLLPDGRSQFVFATLGRSTHGRPVWTAPAAVKAHRKTRDLWIIGTDAAKEQVFGRLALVELGPGYCHYPQDRGIGWFDGLTAEHAVTKYKAGRAYRTYMLKRSGIPNEPLDCRTGAYAVLVGVQAMGLSLKDEAKVIADFTAMQDPAVRKAVEVARVARETQRDEPGWLGETRGWI